MLVLSRRSDERIVFPTLGVTLQVLRIKGNIVRIGIEAPPEVPVLRQELTDRPIAVQSVAASDKEATHSLCNQLSKITLALHLCEKLWENGQMEEARSTLSRAMSDLCSIDRDKVMSQFSTSRPTKSTQRKCRTLVVEDDSNERELLAGLLKMHGCECITAADGTDALDYLASHDRPDLLLLDMWMPRCDGASMVRELRSNTRYTGLKVFSISSTSPQEMGLSTGPDGVDVWFPKPLNPGKLWEAIQSNFASASGPN